MTRTLFLAALFMLSGTSTAGAPQGGGAFGVVTFTRPSGETWVDSGVILEDHQYASERAGYTYRFVVFPDHVNEYHLDEGRVDIVWR